MRWELLSRPEFVVFTTREFAFEASVPLPTASRQLTRAAQSGALVRVTRGVWANPEHPYFHPLGCVPRLLGPEQGYVSLLTALHLHDVLSQIPAKMQVATTGHGRELRTPVGTFEFFKIAPHLMRDGIEWTETHVPYRLATPEKALLDTLYLSTRRRRRFSSLPELDLSLRKFRVGVFRMLVAGMDNRALAAAIEERFEALLAHAPHRPAPVSSGKAGAGR